MQYKILYCGSRGSGLLDCVATQGSDTASQAMTRRWAKAGAERAGAGGRAGRGSGRAGRSSGRVGRCSKRRECAARALGAQAKAVHSVHLACFLARFDSVLFLSQILDVVREPG